MAKKFIIGERGAIVLNDCEIIEIFDAENHYDVTYKVMTPWGEFVTGNKASFVADPHKCKCGKDLSDWAKFCSFCGEANPYAK